MLNELCGTFPGNPIYLYLAKCREDSSEYDIMYCCICNNICDSKDEFEKILKDLIERPPGKPKLVPDEDKRIEIKNTAEIDFKEEM